VKVIRYQAIRRELGDSSCLSGGALLWLFARLSSDDDHDRSRDKEQQCCTEQSFCFHGFVPAQKDNVTIDCGHTGEMFTGYTSAGE
jgi:hypothetical protein